MREMKGPMGKVTKISPIAKVITKPMSNKIQGSAATTTSKGVKNGPVTTTKQINLGKGKRGH